ncbi:hypothetical protein ACIBUY_23125 [Streptomyces sp. NPDC050085]|uniref:hypothetical protein n=1 Tax=Streptomyces sp. NPDC050085 TaxID=3365600 RepID=UPI0037B05A3A
MASTASPHQSADTVDWQGLKGLRVVLETRWMQDDDERPGREAKHQGVVTDVQEGTGQVELTLTRYDGRSLVLRPLGRFTVTDDATGTALYTPAVPVTRRIPADFLAAVRQVAPERRDDLDWMRRGPVGELPAHKALEFVELAGQVEWECTREGDLLADADSPAARWAEAARFVAQTWASDAGLQPAE